jgi:hypothetical protein
VHKSTLSHTFPLRLLLESSSLQRLGFPSEILVMKFPVAIYSLLHLRSMYSPRHLVLKFWTCDHSLLGEAKFNTHAEQQV